MKTGMYYLRTRAARAAADAIKFTVDTSVLNNVTDPFHFAQECLSG